MSYAAPANPVVGDKRVQQALARQEKRGKDPDVNRVLARHLAAGRGLSAQVVNKYNDGKYSDGRSTLPLTFGSLSTHDKLDERFGRGSAANIAGLRGAELGKGDVYMGATKVDIPGYSHTDHQSGHTATPGSTRYDITVLPRWMVKPPQSAEAAPASPGASNITPAEVPVDLTKAREAFDRAGAYKSQGSGLDLTVPGPYLHQNIYNAGVDGVADYEQRFIPELMANANLTAQEIRFGASSALDNLPDDLKLPTYDKVFPKKATAKQGLYRWLEKRLA